MGVVGRIRNSREIVVHNGSGYEDWKIRKIGGAVGKMEIHGILWDILED